MRPQLRRCVPAGCSCVREFVYTISVTTTDTHARTQEYIHVHLHQNLYVNLHQHTHAHVLIYTAVQANQTKIGCEKGLPMGGGGGSSNLPYHLARGSLSSILGGLML